LCECQVLAWAPSKSESSRQHFTWNNDIVYCNVKTVQLDEVDPTGSDSLNFYSFTEQAVSETARDCGVERIPPAYVEGQIHIVSPLQSRRGGQGGRVT
jgi:hypothetical protein